MKIFHFILFQMITKEMFEDVVKDMQREGILVVTGKNTIRLCNT